MDSMNIKGIAWVGNIYQKFEAMCLEVEEAMSQETAKYVENQVQTVGASMKRFCSDVVQDFNPPSSKDLSRVASHDLSLNPYLEFGIHKKPISCFKEDAIDPVCVKGISEMKSNYSNDVWEDWSAASFNWEISDNDEANCDRIDVQASNDVKCESRGQQEGQMCNVTVDTSFDSPPPATTVFTKSSIMVGKRSRCISSSNIIRAKCTDTCESNLVSQMGLQATSNTSSSQSLEEDSPPADLCDYSRIVSQTHSDITANTQCGQPAADDVLHSHTGTSIDSHPDLKVEKENDTTVKMIEPPGRESESGFEESCILVDGNDYRLDTYKEEIRRLFKKKYQTAFSLKKKPSRKQEYKHLAAQYGKFSDEAIAPAPSLSKTIKSKKLATNDSIESEWELL